MTNMKPKCFPPKFGDCRIRRLLLVVTLGVAVTAGRGPAVFGVSPALAQEPAPLMTATVPTQDRTSQQPYAVGVTEPKPTAKQFAFTFNPLNLLIGRYGFNFEYQPVPHHGMIATPHYNHVSGDPAWDGESMGDTDTLSGVGAELGYRFYSGRQGFDGFFAGPSLLVGTYKQVYTNGQSTPPGAETRVALSSVGLAIDIGGQWQLGHFVAGGGVGVQYTTINEKLSLSGRGVDAIIDWTVGGGLRPRLAFNLGYAF